MAKDNFLKWALFISVIMHSTLFWQLPRFDILPLKKASNKIEVTYFQIKNKPKTAPAAPLLIKNPTIKENAPKIKQLPQNNTLGSGQKTTVIKKVEEQKTTSPNVTVSKKKEEEKKGGIEKLSKDPVYLTYTQILHQKIRQIALKNCPKKFENGVVFVTFTLNSNGELKTVEIVEDKSSAETTLKEIARKSIEEAAPYPKFPESFNQTQIPFSVIISFENERQLLNE